MIHSKRLTWHFLFFLFTAITFLFATTSVYSQSDDPYQKSGEYQDEILSVMDKDFEQAEKLLEEMLDKYPFYENIVFAGQFYAKAKMYDKASEYWRSTLVQIEYEYPYIENLYRNNLMYEQLLELYLDARSKLKNEDYYLNSKIIKTYILLNQFMEAADFVITVTKHNIRYLSNYISLFDDVLKENKKVFNRLLKGINDIEKSVQIPDDAEEKVKNNLLETINHIKAEKAKLYYFVEEFSQSIEIYIDILKSGLLAENDAISIVNIFINNAPTGQLIKLLDTYLSIYKESNRLPYYLMLKAELYFKEKDFYNASQTLTEYMKTITEEQSPSEYGKMQYMLGVCYFNLGTYEKAVSSFKANSFYKTEENDIYLARSYIAVSEFEQAETLLEKMLQTRKNASAAYYLSLLRLFSDDINNVIYSFQMLLNDYSSADYIPNVLEILDLLYQIHSKEKELDIFKSFYNMYLKRSFPELFEGYSIMLENAENPNLKAHIKIRVCEAMIDYEMFEKVETILKELSEEQKKESITDYYKQKALFMLGKTYIMFMEKQEQGKEILLKLLKETPNTVFGQQIKEIIKKHS